jgi:Yip1 domain
MTPEAVRPSEPEPAHLGAFARVTGVFFEPGKTFEDIGRKPTWFLPLILTILAGLAFYVTYGQRVGWQRFVDQQVATNARAQQQMERVPPEQRQQAAAMQAKMTGIMFYASAVLFVPIVIVISSAILLGITAMMSAGLKFKQVFAVVCFAGLPMVVKHLLSIVVVFLKNPDDFNVQNPLAFNIAAFMDQATASKFLYTIASAFDLFAIWVIVLTGIGLSAAAGKKKLSVGGGIFAAAMPWVVFVLFGASMAAMFS